MSRCRLSATRNTKVKIGGIVDRVTAGRAINVDRTEKDRPRVSTGRPRKVNRATGQVAMTNAPRADGIDPPSPKASPVPVQRQPGSALAPRTYGVASMAKIVDIERRLKDRCRRSL